jgi:hypothetical protein
MKAYKRNDPLNEEAFFSHARTIAAIGGMDHRRVRLRSGSTLGHWDI